MSTVAGRQTGPIGLGCMGMTWAYGAGERDEAESLATIHRALELGVTLLDTADVYGPYMSAVSSSVTPSSSARWMTAIDSRSSRASTP